ncbi:MAG: four-carbon acid sugar kinase family protein [Anaerolineae bacterium]|nr:four-carbon acid sugar kinase family protein [Anaerolineae bacterium]MDW8172702.1 four-carbon acid sugar kinase family protein [Anaerolineae bacterium]
MSHFLLTFYGDDFTGSTDVMEALTLGGVPTVLFLEPPSLDLVAQHFPQARAVGVAGVSRSMSPAQMDAALPPIFQALQVFSAPLFHYKICSTFDSSPQIGSIGHAIEIGLKVFGERDVPLVVGAPILKRYVVFGNLFATFGDDTYRLDRHPTMKQHPITPMDEADLRLHLGRQTSRPIGLVDIRSMTEAAQLTERYQQQLSTGCQIVLFDTLNDQHLRLIGEHLWTTRGEGQRLIVGSSGVEYALTAHWQRSGLVEQPEERTSSGMVDQMAVISGSAAPQTAAQIRWAIEQGFQPIRLDTPRLVDPGQADAARAEALEQAVQAIAVGQSVVMFSTIGPDDPHIEATRQRMGQLGINPYQVGTILGTQQGMLLRELLERTKLKRVCVSGGDTCGYSARQLGVYALEYVMPIAPGSPLCRARSHHQEFDGLEISLKAGQVGKPDYFGSILRGHA